MIGKDRRILASWCRKWFLAAVAQNDRVIAADTLEGRELEMLHLVSSLHYMRTAAISASGDRCVVEELDRVAPDLKDIRDMICHFDEYAIGEGRLQRSVRSRAVSPIWTIMLSGAGDRHSFSFLVDGESGGIREKKLDVVAALKAGEDIVCRVVADSALEGEP